MLSFLLSVALAADPTKPHEHTGTIAAYKGAPPAVTLTSEEQATLASGSIVLHQERNGNSAHAVAFLDIRSTPSTVWSRILNYSMYPTWVDNVAECEVYKRDGRYIYTRFVLNPIGMNVEYFIKHTYDPGSNWLTWTLDYGRLSDLDESVGYWRVTPISTEPARTRLEYSVDIRFKGWIPQFAQDMIANKGLTNAVAWVKKQSEGG